MVNMRFLQMPVFSPCAAILGTADRSRYLYAQKPVLAMISMDVVNATAGAVTGEPALLTGDEARMACRGTAAVKAVPEQGRGAATGRRRPALSRKKFVSERAIAALGPHR